MDVLFNPFVQIILTMLFCTLALCVKLSQLQKQLKKIPVRVRREKRQ